MALNRTPFNALVDDTSDPPGTNGSIVDKALIDAVLLDPIDAEIARLDAVDAVIAARAPAPGTAAHVLTSNGAGVAPTYQAAAGGVVYRAALYNTAAISVTHAVITDCPFAGEFLDVGGLHDPVTNNTRITIPAGAGGDYVLVAWLSFATHATGVRILIVKKNGSEIARMTEMSTSGVQPHALQRITVLSFVATDYLEVAAYQESGTTLSVDAQFAAFKVG